MQSSHNMSRQIRINIESKLYESGCRFDVKMKIVAFILTRDKLQASVKSSKIMLAVNVFRGNYKTKDVSGNIQQICLLGIFH